MNERSALAILRRINSGQAYDLSVEYFVGMPSYSAFGQPRYQIWNVHTPQGTIVDDPTGAGAGAEANSCVTYSGSAISMYAHTGTHVDALSHFGLNGRVWNGFSADEHLGDRGWRRGGVENYPPIIARGVPIDIAALKGVDEASLQVSGTVMPQDGRLRGARRRRLHVTIKRAHACRVSRRAVDVPHGPRPILLARPPPTFQSDTRRRPRASYAPSATG
jgi:hypothetical protein